MRVTVGIAIVAIASSVLVMAAPAYATPVVPKSVEFTNDKTPFQSSASKPGNVSEIGGIPGNSARGPFQVCASPLSFPALISPVAVTALPKQYFTWPDIRSLIACAPPRYGT